MKLLLVFLCLSQIATAQTFTTKNSGRASDPRTWGGVIPPSSATVIIKKGDTLVLDGKVMMCELIISKGATLTFDSSKQTTLTLLGNLINYGSLIRKPSSVYDSIVFIGINEHDYKGGGMEIIETDKGLWVRGDGMINISGNKKTEWINLEKAAHAGDSIITLNHIPQGWRIGDELCVAPTNPPSVKDHHKQFDVRKIVSITGSLVTLDEPLTYDHPAVLNEFNGKYFTAEVMNLTRTFYMGGTGDGSAGPENNGRAHINIMNNVPSFIRYAEIRHMGPRQWEGRYTKETLGRYPLHFHHCMNGSAGSYVEGVVVRNSGGHAYVPHASNGITFKRNIAFDTYEHQYWWDVPPDRGKDTVNNSNDIVYDSCIGAKIQADPEFRGYRLANFHLGSGLRNTVINCITFGNYGGSGAAGFMWPETSNHTDNLWTSKKLLSHNNRSNGLFTWQNDLHPHTIDSFIAYHNGFAGIEHGAYINSYKYKNIFLIKNKNSIYLHANAVSNGFKDEFGYTASFVNIKATDPLYISRHLVFDNAPTLFRDCVFPKVIINEVAQKNPRVISGWFDFVNCDLGPDQFKLIRLEKGSRFRVQEKSRAFEISEKGRKNIADFEKAIQMK